MRSCSIHASIVYNGARAADTFLPPHQQFNFLSLSIHRLPSQLRLATPVFLIARAFARRALGLTIC